MLGGFPSDWICELGGVDFGLEFLLHGGVFCEMIDDGTKGDGYCV